MLVCALSLSLLTVGWSHYYFCSVFHPAPSCQFIFILSTHFIHLLLSVYFKPVVFCTLLLLHLVFALSFCLMPECCIANRRWHHPCLMPFIFSVLNMPCFPLLEPNIICCCSGPIKVSYCRTSNGKLPRCWSVFRRATPVYKKCV